ncbi:MAG: S24 family peptidase [Synergistaceae bacterium]|nr:S24 family peptidase [Synergistaceae bacterium]
MSELAKAIKRKRKEQRLTQAEFAKIYNVEIVTVSRWENDDQVPRYSILAKMGLLNLGNNQPVVESNVRLGTKFIEIPLLTMATAASCGAGNGLYGVIPGSTENIFVEVSTFKCLDETRKPFAIPIEGDSMTGAGLEEGANAVINPAEEVMNGDAALISCDGDWLIKWVVYNPDGSIDLKPANPNYSPRHIESVYASDPTWFSIIGKVVAVVRKSVPKRAF